MEYTSSTPFRLDEALSWWIGYDALETVERELRGVDQVLADCGRPRLAARGVARIEEPSRLAEIVQTEGWTPVDARLKVSDVVRLARTLGGEQLYGNGRLVPLRELIQNAADAVRARRLVEEWPGTWGEVTVRLGADESGDWVEVEDTGVGMSQATITGPLLDFGTSFWGSIAMLDEHPGLAAKGFQAAGRYGIGFFSIFMWGERVSVTSRRYDEAQSATRVLEFERGLDSRPVLRPARKDEWLKMGGTRVRVYPKKSPYEASGMLADTFANSPQSRPLISLCAWLCPTIDVDLWTQEKSGQRELAVHARDWITMDGHEFLSRLWDLEQYLANWPQDAEKWRRRAYNLGERLRLVEAAASRHNAGEVVGRLCMDIQHNESADFTRGIVTVGGFRSNIIEPAVGVLTGTPFQASRDTGTPEAGLEELAAWTMGQIPLVPSDITDPQRLMAHAEVVRLCGGHTGALPIAEGATGWLCADDVETMARNSDEVFLMDQVWLGIERKKYDGFRLQPNVIATREGRSGLIRGGPMQMGPYPLGGSAALSKEDQAWAFHKATLHGACVEALAKGWEVTVMEVVKSSKSRLTNSEEPRVAANAGEDPIEMHVSVFSNPRGG